MSNYQSISLIRKFAAPEFVFGRGSTGYAGKYCRGLGLKKVFIVTDRGIITNGLSEVITSVFADEKIDFHIFSDISPNPKDYEVMRGAEAFKNCGCDSILAVGGGSVIDAAKGIGIVSTNERNIVEFEGIDKIVNPMPPIICIPTTAGTAADISQFCIINYVDKRVKIAIISKSLIPDAALIDPLNLVTMPAFLSACTGIDALVHAVEAFVSTGSSYVTDIHAREAIKLINENLYDSIKGPDDVERRAFVMMGSLQAGLAFSNASLGCVHAMAHSLGGYLDLPHGECNALLLGKVVNYNFDYSVSKFREIAGLVGVETTDKSDSYVREALVDYFENFRIKCGVKGSLSSRGVVEDDIAALADKAYSDPCLITNPGKMSVEDIKKIYREAL